MKLLPCPFCNGEAETNTAQGYRRISDGVLRRSVTVRCTKCSATLATKCDDFPEYDPGDLLTILREAWNCRNRNDPLLAHERRA